VGRQHRALASRDVSTASREAADAARGRELGAVQVRDTPQLVPKTELTPGAVRPAQERASDVHDQVKNVAPPAQ
jgi:hypothetical protein